MTVGREFRDAYRRALADRHKAARNRRGKRPKGLARPDAGRAGYRREPPARQEDSRTS